uniref:Uncharacterized protein n=1 Tax=Pristionchus pacificus TaxID=54126 RepID=A0A2A6CG63_PRIPA|eukprot:PDM77215.1 hypothetical protein PRIPAC_43127 [Pristionchus pacificus]
MKRGILLGTHMSRERARFLRRSGLEVGLGLEREEEEVDDEAAEFTRGRINCNGIVAKEIKYGTVLLQYYRNDKMPWGVKDKRTFDW